MGRSCAFVFISRSCAILTRLRAYTCFRPCYVFFLVKFTFYSPKPVVGVVLLGYRTPGESAHFVSLVVADSSLGWSYSVTKKAAWNSRSSRVRIDVIMKMKRFKCNFG